jgi:hypothetical protein
LGRIFTLSSMKNTLVGVSGRVGPLLGGLASRLAGPWPWQIIRLARRVPSLVAGFLPWLAGHLVAWPFRWLGQARRWWVGGGVAGCPAAQAPSGGSSTSENFWRVGRSNWANARRIGSSIGVGQKYQMASYVRASS